MDAPGKFGRLDKYDRRIIQSLRDAPGQRLDQARGSSINKMLAPKHGFTRRGRVQAKLCSAYIPEESGPCGTRRRAVGADVSGPSPWRRGRRGARAAAGAVAQVWGASPGQLR